MPIHKNDPKRFTPRGICDAYDSTDAFLGACRTLQNLIFDQANPEIVVARPGVGAPITTFGSFILPTYVSVLISLGNMIYGMVSTSRNSGYDEPFAYNVATRTFVSISGVTSGNVPLSPLTSGDWTPPTMSVVSTKILITHPGFSGTGTNFIGVIDITAPATPAWSTSNLATNPLPSVPNAVANFNNRAYYAIGNKSYYSDSLNPLVATNAGQIITHGDTTPITGYGGLPVQTTSAGIVQALTVFKQFQIWQVTGDPATNFPVPLQNNYLSLTLGSNSPRSIVQTPFGVIFIAVDGPYFIDTFGVVRPLTKEEKSSEQDLQIPFQNTTTPTRTAGGFIGSIYRSSVYTLQGGAPLQLEYWFDLNRRRWTGPHSFSWDCLAPVGNYFIASDENFGAALFISPVLPSSSSVYNDNGTAITCLLETCALPKDGRMAERQVVESTIELSSYGVPTSYVISALDDQRNTLNQVSIKTLQSGSIWGTNVWGPQPAGSGNLWSGSTNIPHTYNINWTVPLVFQKMSVQVMVTATTSVSIGTQFHRFEDTGYTNAG